MWKVQIMSAPLVFKIIECIKRIVSDVKVLKGGKQWPVNKVIIQSFSETEASSFGDSHVCLSVN